MRTALARLNHGFGKWGTSLFGDYKKKILKVVIAQGNDILRVKSEGKILDSNCKCNIKVFNVIFEANLMIQN